jgi:hypothetical protein
MAVWTAYTAVAVVRTADGRVGIMLALVVNVGIMVALASAARKSSSSSKSG